ncbi:MAG: ATP-dependent Clp protease ATP-binding subunit [bacterium]|nr:ATP-dependent Clp protease ATP-binding subunit [bacterium]
MAEKNDLQFTSCPVCVGNGVNDKGLKCSNCAGLGLGVFYFGKFYYWGLIFGRAMIKLRHLKKNLHLILNLVVFILGILGLIALGWWIWLISNHSNDLTSFAFWQIKHWLILAFWISVIADMFIIYRISEEEVIKQKIDKPKYNEKNDVSEMPNNWRQLSKAKAKYKIEVSFGFNYEAIKVLEDAYILADTAKNGQVCAKHLFFSLLKNNNVLAIFSRLNLNLSELIAKVENQLVLLPSNQGKTFLSNELKEILISAYLTARDSGQKKVKPAYLILPILAKDKILSEVLYELEVDSDKINNVIQWFAVSEKMVDNYHLYRAKAHLKPSGNMDRAYTAIATPVLNHFAFDLTLTAKWGRLALCVGRKKEIEAIWQNLESNQFGIILVGEVGVGKNTIIGQIAHLMVEENVPKILKDKRLMELDLPRLLSGASPEKAEERLLVILDEVSRAGNIILYINNIENLMGITAGEEQSLDLSEVLANAIERKNLICLTTSTNENYAKYLENKPLGNVLAKIIISEPEINQAIQIVESKINFFEAKHKVYFSYNSIAKAVDLTDKYIHDKYLPAKAIEILESIAVGVAKTKGINSLVTENDVAKVVSEITKIPVAKITESESEALLNLEEKIHQRMVDQVEAVSMVSASLRRARAGLREMKRPIASFLFMGPTGVGKTELAKTVAEVYFKDEEYMIRLDMSEYQHPDSVEKMIGNSDGALGYLTEAVRKMPFSLILLDEFEKAHPDILNLFLQVMDDGRLTDAQGKTIDFTNSIIIATSNVGAVFIQDNIVAGVGMEEIKQKLINEHLNKVLRPELINRFDGIIVFKPLSIEDVRQIAKIMLAKVGKMLEAKGFGFNVSDEGIKKIAQEGFDPKFGARPLRRLIQEKIENEIANKILSGNIKRRDVIIIDDNGLVLIEKGKKL